MLNLAQNSLTGQERGELSPEVFCFVHPSLNLPGVTSVLSGFN